MSEQLGQLSDADLNRLGGIVLKQLGGLKMTEKAVSSTPTGTYGHGPGGLFAHPALERPIFSAMLLPRMGLQNLLPVRGSRFANPLYGIFTGVTATTGTEPTGVCDDPPTVGLSKLCEHSFVYGRMARQSRVFDIDRIGLLNDRGEHADFQFMGNPWQSATDANTPTYPGMSGPLSNVLNNEVGKALFELGVGMSRDFARDLYSGNPTNNTPGGGRAYYYGLDTLINTGYRDAITSVVCPAADSIVRSFGNLDVASNGATFVRQVTNIFRNLRYISSNAGLDPVQWAISMPWAMFYEVTEVWPCAYLTYRCTNLASGNTAFVDSNDAIKLRDDMRGNVYDRTGQYLLIDGVRVPVVLDDAITELGVGSGSFRSTMYFVPLTVMGGTPTLFMEYLDYSSPNGALGAARALAPDGSFSISDNGRFMWHKKPPTNFCVQLLVKTQPRVILTTPHLAARLTNVQYTPVQHQRDPFTDGTYFVNGGQTSYNGYVPNAPSYYSPTT